MRNLKRALSLVLAVVMVIGLMVVGASAVSYNDFSDRGEIVNKDAVSMLTTLGIIEGQPDGSYNPAGNVDRAQMAKMISVALTNNEDCDTLYQNVNSGLTDISANWARGYINYCYVRGIIAGRGNNTFDPGANVTGVEAAKMLLAALGYNAEIEGLVGPDWALNTAALAQQLGIFRNFTKDVSESLNRDDAALLIYNALDVEMIQQYSNGYALVYADHRTILSSVFGVVRVEGVVTANEWARLEETDSDAALRTGKTTLDEVVVYDSTTSNTTVPEGVKEDDPVTFNVTTPVEYIGKAVTMYVEKTTILANSNVIGVATNDEANVIHATTATEETLKDLLDGTGIETDKNTQYYVNYGWCEDGATEAVSLINMYPNAQLTHTDTAYYSVNGVDVEVIDNNDDGTAEYVLYLQETLSEVSRYSEKNETVSFYQPTLTNKGLPTGDADTTTRDFDDVVFNDEVDTNDLILYVEYGGRTYISAPEIVTDTMNRLDRDRDNELYITLDNGEEYRQSYIPDAASMVDVDMIHFDIDDRSTREDAPGFDDLFDFILDSNGYVVAIRPAEEQVTNYALVLDSAWTQNALRRGGDIKVLMADGTEGTYAINWDKSADAFEHVTNINGKTTARINGSTKDIADLDNDTKLELYLGTRDVIDGTGSTGDAASSVITYSLNADGDELTIESVLQKNQHVTGTIDIRDDVNPDDTAGVGDSGEIVYIDDSKVANTYQPLQYKLDEAYENGDGDIYIEHVTASNLKNYYAVDLDTVAFYYVDEDNYGVATGWDDMSNVADGTEVQVYPTLEKTTNRTYVATNLAGLILFNAEVDTDSDDYMLVLDANAAARGDKWYLTVVFEDGNVAEITVDDDDLGDFDPDINGDFMQAYAYKENSDGTYSVGDMANNYGKGTAHNYSNRTVAFTQSNRSHYIALANDANVWDVEDVENDGDEAVAANFTKTEVNAVVIMDGGSIRTAWVWDIPQSADPDVDFDTDTELVDVVVDDNASGRRLITIEYTGEEPSTSDLRTLITDELLGYYNKNVNGESVDVEITRFDADEQSVTARVTKTNGGINTEKWYYEFVNDVASETVGSYDEDGNWTGDWGAVDGVAGTYTPNGTWTVNGNEITASFTASDDAEDKANDVARFLGSLYRNGGATQIEYEGETYKWNTKPSELKGSNWTLDGAERTSTPTKNTLVAAIFGQAAISSSTTIPSEITLYVDGVEMTISIR